MIRVTKEEIKKKRLLYVDRIGITERYTDKKGNYYIYIPKEGDSNAQKSIHYKPAFHEAQKHLESYRAHVVNPHDMAIDAEYYHGF
jgi:hypothetical protein